MKRIIALLLALILAFSLVACGNDWKSFLKDYDKWADKYVKVAEAYLENPDENYNDYVKKSNELIKWKAEADGKVAELELNEKEAMEYNQELAKIQQKIISAYK